MFRTRASRARKWKVAKIGFSYLSRMTLKAVLGVLAGYALARASRALNFRREAAEGSTSLEERTTLTLSRKQPTSVLISTRSAFQCNVLETAFVALKKKYPAQVQCTIIGGAQSGILVCSGGRSSLQQSAASAGGGPRHNNGAEYCWCRVLLVQSIAGAEYSGVREHWCRSILESSEWWLAEQSNIGASAKQQAAGFPDTRSSPTFPQHRCISSFPTIEAHQRFPTTEAGISSFPIMVHGKQKPNDQIRYFADRQGLLHKSSGNLQLLEKADKPLHRETKTKSQLSSRTANTKTGLHPLYPVTLARKGMRRALILGPLLWYFESGSLA